MDRLAIELMEDPSIPGRVFFQVLSGSEYGHMSIQTLGSIVLVKGRYVLKNNKTGNKIQAPFECTLDAADSIVVSEITETDYLKSILPKYVKLKRAFNIFGTKFHPLLPVAEIRVDMILGTYRIKPDLVNPVTRRKYVWLYRAGLKWKNLNEIELFKGYAGNEIAEILFDKMTLFTARITLPKIMTLKSLDIEDPPELNNSTMENPAPSQKVPSENKKLTSNPFLQQRLSFLEKLQYILVEKSVSMDIFLFFITQIIWFILWGSYHDSVSVKHTILFMLISALLIINLRSVLAFLLHKIYAFQYRRANQAKDSAAMTTNGRSFFVNGWNAWSFCGSIRQGEELPLYSLPSYFAKSFHDGGIGTALPINLGEGNISISPSYFNKNGKSFINGKKVVGKKKFSAKEEKMYKDYIASDMFTMITDNHTKVGVIIGFLSQRNHFGCVATNETYDQLSVHISGDGVLCPPGSEFFSDFVSIYLTAPNFDGHNPFGIYMSMTSEEHNVKKKLERPFFAVDATHDISTPFANLQSKSQSMNPINLKQEFSTDDIPFRKSFYIPKQQTRAFSDDEYQTKKKKDPNHPEVFTDPGFVGNIPIGWCSWYQYFKEITEKQLRKNIQLLKEKFPTITTGIKQTTEQSYLFQIDDGYQSHWGDWTTLNPKFSKNLTLKPFVNYIKAQNMVPGIWLAPFAADTNSNLIQRFPELILKKLSSSFFGLRKSTKPCNSGFCGKFFYGLDITNPNYQSYLKEVIKIITKIWGFQYLKLDFLYAAILSDSQNSISDRTLTKAQIMQLGMQLINDAILTNDPTENDEIVEDDEEDDGDLVTSDTEVRPTKNEKKVNFQETKSRMKNKKTIDRVVSSSSSDGGDDIGSASDDPAQKKYFLLGCGAPLGSMIGHVHANRVSPDAGLSWEPNIPFFSQDKWNLPSARNMIRNTINRSFMHNKWWINDPDCLLLRDELPFTDDEIIGIATIKVITSGSIIVSDDLEKVSTKRMKIFQKLLPIIPNQSVNIIDLMEKEIPEFFRISFISNHKERIHEEVLNELEEKQNHPYNNLGRAFDAAAITKNDDDEIISKQALLSPFEAILYRQAHHAPQQQQQRGQTPRTPKMQKSMFDSLDFVEERLRVATVQLSYSDEEESLDSFDEDEDHVLPEAAGHQPHHHPMAPGPYPTMMQRPPSFIPTSQPIASGEFIRAVPSADSTSTPTNSKYSMPFRSPPGSNQSHGSNPNIPTPPTHPQRPPQHMPHLHMPHHGIAETFPARPPSVANPNTLPPGMLSPPPAATARVTLEMRCQGIKEKWLDKRDLIKRWVLFTVCNWSEEVKTQFVHVKSIFTEEVLQEFIDYTSFLYDPARKAKRKGSSSHYGDAKKSRRSLSVRQLNRLNSGGGGSFSSALRNPGSPSRHGSNVSAMSTPSVAASNNNTMNNQRAFPEVNHILHLFNFWNESYSYKIINLLSDNEEENEIAFPDVPVHSAHIYSVHLSLHPLIPRYLGSNLHYSCGKEIRHMFMTEALPETIQKLNGFVERVFCGEPSSTTSKAAAAAAAEEEDDHKFTFIVHESSSTSKPPSPSAIASNSARMTPSSSVKKATPAQTPTGPGQNKFRKKQKTLSLQNVLSSTTLGPINANNFVPVIQTMCIGFEQNILRDPDWDGFIWVFLPVNIKRAKLFYNILGKVEIHGTSFEMAEDDDNPADSAQYYSSSSSAFTSHSMSLLTKHQQKNIHIVDYIEETSCRNAGYVYKIKVSSSKYRRPTEIEKNQAMVENAVAALKERKRKQKQLHQQRHHQKDQKDGKQSASSSSSDEDEDGDSLTLHSSSNDSLLGSSASSCGINRSFSMSATLEHIGMTDLIPKPLRFDQNDPGITITPRGGAASMRPLYQSPSRPLQLSNVMKLKKKDNEFVDYLMISWISDMEERVSTIDNPDHLFA